jgi:putative hydrolase of the HAD superfamily
MSRIYIFDAVHTFLRPVPDVLTAYHDVGQIHGSTISKEKLATRFRAARNARFSANFSAAAAQPGSLKSSDAIEYQLWRDLIADVFLEIRPVDKLFEQLWTHFANADNWQLYDDVANCWARLHEDGHRIVVGSNFDSRLNAIVKRFPELSVAHAIFCSAEVGYRKPDPLFYQVVADSFGITDSDEVTMIGDDFENDYIAPKRFGWKALHLNRKASGNAQSHVIRDLGSL